MNMKILSRKFCDYATYFRGFKKNTILRYTRAVNYLCEHTKVEELEEINTEMIRNFFYHGRIEKKWQANTFLIYHKSLKSFFEWCVKEKLLTTSPLIDIDKPKLDKKIPPKLTKQQAMKILEVAYNYPYKYRFLRARNHAILSTFIFSGVRKQELINLNYTDIDLQNLSLFVRQGKGGKDRIIPICYTLADSLQRYLTERKRLKRTCPGFFTSLFKNMGLTINGLNKMFKEIVPATGLKFSPHKLRHTFATLMLEGGADIFSVSKMMGHSDIKTTTIYLAASAEHLRGEMMKHPMNI
jgi:site-specific recombinase XerD